MSFARARALLLTVLLVALGAPLLAFAPPAAADGSARTVEATWHPWNPAASVVQDPDFGPIEQGAYDMSKAPSVTVSQTADLSDQVIRVSWANFTPSSVDVYCNAYDADGTCRPAANPSVGPSLLYGVKVYQCRGTSLVDRYDLDAIRAQCYTPPVFDATGTVDGGFGPNNAIQAATQNDGTGSVDFHAENAVSNDLLRCSPAQPCSLVVVPNQGGRALDGDLSCDDHSQDYFKPPNYDQNAQTALNSEEGNACAWSKRIVVPLSFTPIPGSCPAQSSSFTAAGSPALERGLNQLLSGWCRGDDRVNFDYNSTSNEYLARNRFLNDSAGALTSATDVALVSQPAAAADATARRFVYAPIANDAVAIPYAIDNPKTGRPIDDLRLNARLVAKLLTQSYSPAQWDCASQRLRNGQRAPWCASRAAGNPASIFDDPEFQALNFRGGHSDRASFPDSFPSAKGRADEGTFFPTVLGGDSDLTYTLTRWIASDAQARAFLQGQADSWGMRVNSSYLPTLQQRAAGQTLYPTSQFQALDPGWTAPQQPWTNTDLYRNDPRLRQGFQGSWNPISNLSAVTTNLLTNRSSATRPDGDCYNNLGQVDPSLCLADRKAIPVQFKGVSPVAFGARGLTGVTENTSARAYELPTAQLVTRTGRSIAPTTDAMAAALATMKTRRDGVTQYQDYASIPGDAYPVMLPVYAMVPTCGLTAAKARGIATMLRKVTESQVYGLNPGQLAPGLLALSSAQLAKTRAAQDAVGTQSCVTAPTGNDPAPGPGPGGNAPGPGGAVQNSGGAPGAVTGGGAGTDPSPRGSVRASTSPKPNPAPSGGAGPSTRNVGYPLKDPGGMPLLLPVLLILGGALLVGSPLLWWFSGTAAGQSALARLGVRR